MKLMVPGIRNLCGLPLPLLCVTISVSLWRFLKGAFFVGVYM